VRKLNLVILAIIVFTAGIPCLATADSKSSIADTGIPNNAMTSSVNQTDSPISANATITITVKTLPLPEASVDLETQSKGG